MPEICIIAAAGLHNELGFNNQLLCHLPADLARFKSLTSGHFIVMGRRTWDSLPVKPLPQRTNFVLSQNLALAFPGATPIHHPDEILQLAENQQKIFVIGGEMVFRHFINVADKIYLTRINASFQADSFFPSINEKKWHLLEEIFHPRDAENPYDLKFQTWVKMA